MVVLVKNSVLVLLSESEDVWFMIRDIGAHFEVNHQSLVTRFLWPESQDSSKYKFLTISKQRPLAVVQIGLAPELMLMIWRGMEFWMVFTWQDSGRFMDLSMVCVLIWRTKLEFPPSSKLDLVIYNRCLSFLWSTTRRVLALRMPIDWANW